MAKIELLKDIQVKQSKPKEKKYYLNDGGGLRLCINPNGTKVWIYRYMVNGKSKETTFKSYPTTTLKQARDKRTEFKDLINQGIDPITNKQQVKAKEDILSRSQFKDIMNEWLDKEAEHTKEVTHKGKVRVFINDVAPFVGTKDIKDITINDIINIIDHKKIQAPEIASRLFNYMDNLFRYAVLKGYCNRNILSDIRKSDIIKPRTAKNMPKITDIEILKELVNAIYNYNGGYNLRNALKLVLHIPLRADNLCNLKWEYIDFDKKILTIPRELMKIKNINLDNYIMPLTDEVIDILNEQRTIQTKYTELKEYIFLGATNHKPINKESPNRALERLGFNDEKRGRKIRLHGFRGTFRSLIDTLDTKGLFSFDVKERALDHHDKNTVVRAYTHKANYIEQLKPLMNYWSDFICGLKR
jgi:integrase